MKTTMKKALRPSLFLCLLASFAYVFCNVNYPLILQRILDSMEQGNFQALRGKFLLLLLLMGLLVLSHGAQDLSKTVYLNKARQFYREHILSGIFGSRREALSSQEEAQLLSVFNNDIPMVVTDHHDTLLWAASSLMTLLFGFSALAVVHPLMALLIGAQLILMTQVPRFFRKELQLRKEAISTTLQSYNIKLKDSLFCLPVLKSYLAAEELIRRSNEAGEQTNQAEYRHKKTAVWADLASMTIGYGGDFLTYLLGATLIAKGQLTIGGLLAVIQITNVLANPITTIAYNRNTMEAIRPLREKLFSMMTVQKEEAPRTDGIGSIQAQSLSVEKNGSAILKDINLSMEAGKKYLLIGPNGCGKSTLLKVLNRTILESSGQLLLNGHPNRAYLVDCAMVYQDAALFTGTVRENITLCQPCDEALLQELSRFLGIEELLQERDETAIHRFSGGEKQKIALCRALLRKPKLLLLDEAFSAMDSSTRSHLEDWLLEQDLTLVNIAHSFRREAIERYDSILLMEEGRLTEAAPYKTLSARGKSHIPFE